MAEAQTHIEKAFCTGRRRLCTGHLPEHLHGNKSTAEPNLTPIPQRSLIKPESIWHQVRAHCSSSPIHAIHGRQDMGQDTKSCGGSRVKEICLQTSSEVKSFSTSLSDQVEQNDSIAGPASFQTRESSSKAGLQDMQLDAETISVARVRGHWATARAASNHGFQAAAKSTNPGGPANTSRPA